MSVISFETTLDKLQPGQSAYVKEVMCEGAFLKHIYNIGFVKGAYIEREKGCFADEGIIIRIKGSSIAMRRTDAALIKVSGEKNKEFYDFEINRIYRPRIIHRESGAGIKHFALAGVPNCGKTTLFNKMTGENRKTGNFPGVTVERKDAFVKGKSDAVITDLPGIYSLSPYSAEETVTREFLINSKPDCIINIINAVNPHRGLYLTLQLAELDIPMVIVLNMMDEVERFGGRADAVELEKVLGIPVVAVSASEGKGIDRLLERAFFVADRGFIPGRQNFYGKETNQKLSSFSENIFQKAIEKDLPLRFAASKAAEKDFLVLDELGLSKDYVDGFFGWEICESVSAVRYSFVECICNKIFFMPEDNLRHVLSAKVDSVLLGKRTAFFVFGAVMLLIFYIAFAGPGNALAELLSQAFGNFGGALGGWLRNCDVNPYVSSLVTDGIFAGIGCVVGFFPVVAVLFLLLSTLEDCGYMARVAMITDKFLRHIGLSGKSFVPLFLGFGCSVPAIMATKTLPSEHERRLTAMLVPFISCSAKLPVFLLLSSLFFEKLTIVIIIGLYLFGVAIASVFAVLYNKFIFRQASPFVMELPDYRIPKVSNILRLMWDKSTDFISRAFTVIFLSSVVVWFLKEMNVNFIPARMTDKSILSYIGGLAEPLFKPLGFGNWRVVSALVCGLAAKENIVSTLTVLSAVELFTPDSAASFLVFCLLYTPCIAAVTAVKNEFGLKFAVRVSVFQFAVAWILALFIKIII